jgi:predicted acylesterase/phospholipase RssA
MPSPIVSKGVELSLAVAASSCFPPLFPRFHLTYKELQITFREFKEAMELNDGGVLTNLGIEVVVALQGQGWADKTLVLICDAERMQAHRPHNSPLIDVEAGTAAQSAAARKSVKQEFGDRGFLISFSDREEEENGLSFVAQTNLFDYRTDLDVLRGTKSTLLCFMERWLHGSVCPHG